MAGKTDAFELDFLKLIFNGTPIANIADNAATAPITNLYLSLHTADPTDAAAGQSTNEISYTGYARVALTRDTSSTGWTCATVGGVSSAKPNSTISFGLCTAGSGTATYAGIGTGSSGAGKLLYVGQITPGIVVGSGVTPQFTTQTYISED